MERMKGKILGYLRFKKRSLLQMPEQKFEGTVDPWKLLSGQYIP